MGPYYKDAIRQSEGELPLLSNPRAGQSFMSTPTCTMLPMINIYPPLTLPSQLPQGSLRPNEKPHTGFPAPLAGTSGQKMSSRASSSSWSRHSNDSREVSAGIEPRITSYMKSDNSQEVAELSQLLSAPSSPTGRRGSGSAEEVVWGAHRYSRPGGFDMQKSPAPCVSGPPPIVTTSPATLSASRPPLVPEDSPWFGAEEQTFLNEYYKTHPFPQNKMQNEIENFNHPNRVHSEYSEMHNFSQNMNIQKTGGTYEISNNVSSLPNIPNSTTSPVQATVLSSQNPPVASRGSTVSTPSNASSSPTNVVFLRNYGSVHSPSLRYANLQNPSLPSFQTPLMKNPLPLTNMQPPQITYKKGKAEYLQVNGTNGTVATTVPPFPYPNFNQNDLMQQSLNQFQQYPFSNLSKNYQSRPYNPLNALLTPSPHMSPNSSSPPSFHMLPPNAPTDAALERRTSPQAQRPGLHSYLQANELPPIQVWQKPHSLSPQMLNQDPFKQVNTPEPYVVPQVTPLTQTGNPSQSVSQLPESPPTPPNEPRRFKPMNLTSNVMWVPGEPPKDPPPPPPKPTPEPPRFGYGVGQQMGDYPRVQESSPRRLQESSRPNIYSRLPETARF